MIDAPRKLSPEQRSFDQQVGASVARKLKARNNPVPGLWFGLGVMGAIGWSVTVPTLLGAALGLWLDHHHWSSHSWTLALLVAGLSIGCLNAGFWVVRQAHAIQGRNDDNSEGDKNA